MDVTFFENTLYFSDSLGSTITLSTTPVTLPVPLDGSPSVQVYQRRKKIITDPDNLCSHQSIVFTEVSELPIALWKYTRSCTQHPIAKVLSFFHLYPTYFSIVITLSSLSLSKSYCDIMLDPKWKSAMDKKMTAFIAWANFFTTGKINCWLSMDIHYQISL